MKYFSSVPKGFCLSCLTLLLMVSIAFLPSCGEDEEGTVGLGNNYSGSLIGRTPDCKSYADTDQDRFPSSMECLSYSYDGTDVLSIDHINTGFNCCPGEILADIVFRNDTILITESETEGLCDCYCLFDTYYEMTGIEPKVYTIVFDVPYIHEDDELLSITVDLSASPEGSACVDRISWIWPEEQPEATVESYSGCKVFPIKDNLSATEESASKDCVKYEYGPDNSLVLKRINTGFNCCPTSLGVDLEIEGNTITLKEREVLYNPCRCLCLFDMKIVLSHIPPGVYRIRFIENYTKEGDDPLEFEADLINEPAGKYCVERDNYPWNI